MRFSSALRLLLVSSFLVGSHSLHAASEQIQRPENGSTLISGGAVFEPAPDDLGDDADNVLGGMASVTWLRDNNYFWEIFVSRTENRVSVLRRIEGQDIPDRQDTEQLHGGINTGYMFPQKGNWRPYLSLGIGAGSFDNGAGFDSDGAEFNAGFGGFYEFTERMFLRGDMRLMVREDIDWGPVASLALAMQLGDITPDPPPDADGDGVPDASDLCPDTPRGAQVNSRGCPDSDGDGVYDDADQCTDTPPGTEVDANGCPLPPPPTPEPPQVNPIDALREAADDARILILFEYDRHDVGAEYEDDLRGLAQLLAEQPELDVVIEGHADSRGSDEYNIALSERRASEVRTALVNLGVDAARISIVGKGESEPVASNDTEDGRALNRRAISVFPTID